MADSDSHDLTSGTTTPRPDPTELTDAAIARLEKSLTQYIDGEVKVLTTRLEGIDEATKLRLTGVTDIPTQIDEKVGRLADLTTEKFASVEKRFQERDTRSENEKRDSKVAVDAAFAAQKEASAKQDEGNTKAIDKSERATAETIKTNQDLNAAKTDGLTKGLDEVKDRLTRVESIKLGATEQRQVATESRTALYATIGVAISVVLFGIAIIGFIASQSP